MTTRTADDALVVLACGLCGEHVRLSYPPMGPDGVDGEALARVMLLHVRYGCRRT